MKFDIHLFNLARLIILFKFSYSNNFYQYDAFPQVSSSPIFCTRQRKHLKNDFPFNFYSKISYKIALFYCIYLSLLRINFSQISSFHNLQVNITTFPYTRLASAPDRKDREK